MIDRKNNKAIRAAYGNALVEVGKTNKNVVVLDADVAKSTMSITFKKEFPERFFDMGIAEQNLIAASAGLASQGKIPFASAFAVFATGRTYDQIRNGVCYGNLNVKIVGTHGGITVGEDGASHQALEDISLMRGLPNMTVIVPADCRECLEAVKYAAEINGPVYIRVARSKVPDIFDENHKLAVNGEVLKDGKDVVIISNGETLAEALDAAELLSAKGISAKVINIPVVKPLNNDIILKDTESAKLFVTVENHSIVGGLGSAVCEVLSENRPAKVLRIGINDVFGQSGTSDALLEYYGLTAEKIAEKIQAKMEQL